MKLKEKHMRPKPLSERPKQNLSMISARPRQKWSVISVKLKSFLSVKS